MLQSDIDIFTKYGVDIAPLLKKHGILGDEELAEEEYTDMCVICGRVFPQLDLRAIGAGGQEAPFACRGCVEELRPAHASEDD